MIAVTIQPYLSKIRKLRTQTLAITIFHWVVICHFKQVILELLYLLEHRLFYLMFYLHSIYHLFYVLAVELGKHQELVLHLVEFECLHFDKHFFYGLKRQKLQHV